MASDDQSRAGADAGVIAGRPTGATRSVARQRKTIPRAPTEVSHQDVFKITTLVATNHGVSTKTTAAVLNSKPVVWALIRSAATALSESAGCRRLLCRHERGRLQRGRIGTHRDGFSGSTAAAVTAGGPRALHGGVESERE